MDEETPVGMTGRRRPSGSNGGAVRAWLFGDGVPPLRSVGDWFALAGVILFCVSVFALKWIRVGVDVNRFRDLPIIGSVTEEIPGRWISKEFSLFASPWAWAMVAVLVILVFGFIFVRSRGSITLAVGIFCLIFNVIFLIGAWHKVNAFIGSIAELAGSLPLVGNALALLTERLLRELLDVRVTWGYYFFIATGVLLIVGGLLRLKSGHRETAGPVGNC